MINQKIEMTKFSTLEEWLDIQHQEYEEYVSEKLNESFMFPEFTDKESNFLKVSNPKVRTSKVMIEKLINKGYNDIYDYFNKELGKIEVYGNLGLIEKYNDYNINKLLDPINFFDADELKELFNYLNNVKKIKVKNLLTKNRIIPVKRFLMPAYTIEDAIKDNETNQNCINCIKCLNCVSCNGCNNCVNCVLCYKLVSQKNKNSIGRGW